MKLLKRFVETTVGTPDWTLNARAITRRDLRHYCSPIATTRVQWRIARRSSWPERTGRGAIRQGWSLRGGEGVKGAAAVAGTPSKEDECIAFVHTRPRDATSLRPSMSMRAGEGGAEAEARRATAPPQSARPSHNWAARRQMTPMAALPVAGRAGAPAGATDFAQAHALGGLSSRRASRSIAKQITLTKRPRSGPIPLRHGISRPSQSRVAQI